MTWTTEFGQSKNKQEKLEVMEQVLEGKDFICGTVKMSLVDIWFTLHCKDVQLKKFKNIGAHRKRILAVGELQ